MAVDAWFRAQALDARKGRGAVAARAIRAGSRVLSTAPAVHVSLSACNWCLAAPPAARLSTCGGCRRARYCSRRCQQADWGGGRHKLECSSWRESIPRDVSRPQTLLLVARAVAGMYLSPLSPLKEAAEIQQLRHHYEDHTPEKLVRFREMARLVLLLLARSKFNAAGKSVEQLGDELLDCIVRMFCRVECNAFTICDDANARVGIGLFPRGALLNHSCVPNCVASFRGRQLILHAVRDVSPGEELTISYVELLMSTSKRRQALAQSYYFDCDCRRCTSAELGESSDDWFLDGLACPAEHCTDGVVLTQDDPLASMERAFVCRECGVSRDHNKVATWERKLSDTRHALKELRLRADSTELEQWEMHQQLWQIVQRGLKAHRKSALVATTARDVGNFLIEVDSGVLCKPGGQPPRALPFFVDELQATEWIVPDIPLPSRGLLHFQIAKLLVEDLKQRRVADSRDNTTLKLVEDADRHIKAALSILECALGADNPMFERAVLFQQDVERLRGLLTS